MDAGRCHVIDMEKLSHRFAATPYGYGLCLLYLGFMKSADQRGDHMAIDGMKVIPLSIEIGGHHRAVVGTVLAVIGFTQFDTGDLCDGIGFVGGLQDPGEQLGLFHWLVGELGVDAGASEEQQSVDTVLVGRVDYVALDHQVLVDELGGIFVVGVDAPNLGRSQVDLIDLLLLEELRNRLLVGEIELTVGASDVLTIPSRLQLPDNG